MTDFKEEFKKFTKRGFRTYTVPYRYEEYLLQPQDKYSKLKQSKY